jgi:hypothetical protein
MQIIRVDWADYLVPKEISGETILRNLIQLKQVDSVYRDGKYYYYLTGDGFRKALECREIEDECLLTSTEKELLLEARTLKDELRSLKVKLDKAEEALNENTKE